MQPFVDRLDEAVARVGTPALLGLDPHLARLPPEFAGAADRARPRAERAALVAEFLREVIDLAAGRVAAVKPQSAFFELLGADGAEAWENVVDAAREAGLLVIGDVKRGDIASTARAYAEAHLADPNHACDAITVNPYLGRDSLEPFVEVCREQGAGLFVLVRTSNPGSAEFQAEGEPRLCDRVARAVDELGAGALGSEGRSSIGAVVGATHPAELAGLRARMPRATLLLPGYGAQGAGGADLAPAFFEDGRGALVNSSRGILFAWQTPAGEGLHWKDAARAALDAMIEDLRGALPGSA